MNNELDHIINTIAKGDTRFVETFFKKPGSRKYLENITLILLHTLPNTYIEKEELYAGFLKILDKMEARIERQKAGEKILKDVFEH